MRKRYQNDTKTTLEADSHDSQQSVYIYIYIIAYHAVIVHSYQVHTCNEITVCMVSTCTYIHVEIWKRNLEFPKSDTANQTNSSSRWSSAPMLRSHRLPCSTDDRVEDNYLAYGPVSCRFTTQGITHTSCIWSIRHAATPIHHLKPELDIDVCVVRLPGWERNWSLWIDSSESERRYVCALMSALVVFACCHVHIESSLGVYGSRVRSNEDMRT